MAPKAKQADRRAAAKAGAAAKRGAEPAGIPVCCPERAANWAVEALQLVDQLKVTYDEVQIDAGWPACINAIDWETLRRWHALRPVPDGPRVLTLAKLLQCEPGREHGEYLAAFQMFAFSIAFELPGFKRMRAELQQQERMEDIIEKLPYRVKQEFTENVRERLAAGEHIGAAFSHAFGVLRDTRAIHYAAALFELLPASDDANWKPASAHPATEADLRTFRATGAAYDPTSEELFHLFGGTAPPNHAHPLAFPDNHEDCLLVAIQLDREGPVAMRRATALLRERPAESAACCN